MVRDNLNAHSAKIVTNLLRATKCVDFFLTMRACARGKVNGFCHRYAKIARYRRLSEWTALSRCQKSRKTDKFIVRHLTPFTINSSAYAMPLAEITFNRELEHGCASMRGKSCRLLTPDVPYHKVCGFYSGCGLRLHIESCKVICNKQQL